MSARDVLAAEYNGPEADSILALLSAAGYAVVPREPTEAMVKAGAAAQWRKMQDVASPTPTEHPDDGGGSLGYAYRAMIAAGEATP